VDLPVRFHVLLLPNVPWPDLRVRARQCEALGFDLIGLADHLVDWTNPANTWFEAWSVLGALAEATSTIRLTTLVTQIPLRNPVMLAKQAITLDHISGGRLEIGLGTGLTIDPSYAMAGLPNWAAAERVARFAEYVELIDRVLREDEATYSGRYYTAEGAQLRPRSVQQPRPPILIAALAPKMLEIAAQQADIWNSLSFRETPAEQLAETRERIAAIRAMCALQGRDPATLRMSYTMFDGRARHRGGAIGYFDSLQAFEDQVGPLLEAGISEIGLYYPLAPNQVPLFERIATDVLPRLRGS
jgi:alkanesulfonate monooxygenase SsuD/methylene tetrahydromethanopterin reductase-like flavin-dependent oxidoreductase (luciferase family)